MSVIHAPRKPELELRMLVFPTMLMIIFSVLFLRLWYFQVVQSPELVERAERDNTSEVPKLAPRGLIFDRKGRLLAGIRPELVITGTPAVINKNPWVLDKLATMLKVEKKRLEDKVKDAYWRQHIPSPIFVGAPIEVATRVAEAGADLPGLGVETQPMRFYPDTFSFTHMLGYAWVPSEGDVKRLNEMDIKPAQYVGKAGIEYVYERELMGEPGAESLEVDARGRPLRVVGRDNPTPGAQLTLSIDAKVQKTAQWLLKEYTGAAVAIDPRTGEVICLVSSPTYDLGLFQGGISHEEYARLNGDDKPQLNRAIYSAYSPGSTFKVVTALAAYKEGKFNPNEAIYCPGYYAIGRRKMRCMSRHGSISFQRAMAKSCNTYFATLGFRAGPDAVRELALGVGIGQKSGIDVTGEGKGIVPTQEWIEKWRKPAIWYGGDTANISIGQGELQATPLQMANVAALIAMEGINYKPHVVRAIRHSHDAEAVPVTPEELHRVEATPEFWRQMKAAMVDVIEDGTAGTARIEGVQWGGKTGSTEHGKGKKTHGWFIGVAPMDNPKIAVAVLLEGAGHGGSVAAPIAREIVKAYLSGDANKAK